MARSMYGGREWDLTSDGVVVAGESRPRRTGGKPLSVRHYLAAWHDQLVTASYQHGVPLTLLLATVCTENGPARLEGLRPEVRPAREEPGYVSDGETPDRVSVGPCHVLISTARGALGRPEIDRAWLADVLHNLRAAAAYIASQRGKTEFDPVLVAAAYNAGGLYEARPGESRYGNPWHLRTYGNHIDRFVAWYGDSCRVIQEHAETFSLDRGGLGRVRDGE